MSKKPSTKKPADIVFDDLAAPQLTRLQKLALNGSKNAKVTFTQEAVLSAAKEATGLTDFGPRPFHEALQVLLDDYAGDTGLSGVGASAMFQRPCALRQQSSDYS